MDFHGLPGSREGVSCPRSVGGVRILMDVAELDAVGANDGGYDWRELASEGASEDSGRRFPSLELDDFS